MYTTDQNDKNDYDIDVGVVFESDALGSLSHLAIRNKVANAVKGKTKQFAEKPEVKTSCVRLKYLSTGYREDFAVFKRHRDNNQDKGYIYEYVGAERSLRHLKAMKEKCGKQFKKGSSLRKVLGL